MTQKLELPSTSGPCTNHPEEWLTLQASPEALKQGVLESFTCKTVNKTYARKTENKTQRALEQKLFAHENGTSTKYEINLWSDNLIV